jgi:hypothetical protein
MVASTPVPRGVVNDSDWSVGRPSAQFPDRGGSKADPQRSSRTRIEGASRPAERPGNTTRSSGTPWRRAGSWGQTIERATRGSLIWRRGINDSLW